MKRDLPLPPRAAAPADDHAGADARWELVRTRDRAGDGRFFYSVDTTGVYCRPSCGARLPRREHVSFHATAADAERAGFRACLRCHPNGPTLAERQSELVTLACRHIEASEAEPSLDALAAAAGLSPHHFHRVFKAVAGVTPKAYAKAHRAGRVREELAQPGGTVTAALYEAGYASNARFYADAPSVLGMPPRAYRAGGTDADIRFAVAQSSLGAVLVAASDTGLCAITLGDDPEALVRDLQDRFPKAVLRGGDPAFEQQVAQVVGLVENPSAGHALPLDIRGTAFQQRVWQALRQIPPGETRSYTQVARQVGAPTAVRAVAAACAANALAVAVPCHRVVRSDGALSGYRWGIERKRQLLDREGTDR